MQSRQPHEGLKIIPIHATLPLETIQRHPLPVLPPIPIDAVPAKKKQRERQQQLIDFCSIYSALLDDVEALDTMFENKYSNEILRLVANTAISFGIGANVHSNHGRSEAQVNLVDRLERLARTSSNCAAVDIEPVQGLSGATVLDYLVALIAIRSPTLQSNLRATLDTLGKYQRQFFKLRITQEIERILRDNTKPSSKSQGSKERLRRIGLPNVIFICLGPHMQDETDDPVWRHVIASSAETFSEIIHKEWAQKMHQKRIHYVSVEGYQQVCVTERAFWKASSEPGLHLGGDDGREKAKEATSNINRGMEQQQAKEKGPRIKGTETTRRANYIPYWQTMHHWPDAPGDVVTESAPGASANPGRIGVFNHSNETAGAFDVMAGFKYRARCFKCASVYLYHQNNEFLRAEADMDGPHRTEPPYNRITHDDGGKNSPGEPLVYGPTCAEPLGHLLCSNKA